MRGTLICGVTDEESARDAVEVALELSERLGLRLVLAHAADGIEATLEGEESVSARAARDGAQRLLLSVAREHGIAERVERREGVGDAAAVLGRIAAEEAADLIVVGGRRRGRLRPRLESPLAEQLDGETGVPVVIAPPRARGRP